jgi:hypothetical protein
MSATAQAPAKPGEPVYLTARQVLQRYNRVNLTWLWRRLKNDQDFPKPIYIGDVRYWSIAALEAYENRPAPERKAFRGARAAA